MCHRSRYGWLSLLACLAPALAQSPAAERQLTIVVRPFRELEGGAGYGEQAQRAVLDALSRARRRVAAEVFLPCAEQRYDYLIDGSVSQKNQWFTVEAHCTDRDGHYLANSSVTSGGADLRRTCAQAVTNLAVRVTGGDAVGADADNSQVCNDNSTARLTVRFGQHNPEPEGQQRLDRRQDAGLLAIYLKKDWARIKVSASQPGYILVLDVGVSHVWQLYPPHEGDRAAIRQGQTLDLPDKTCAEAGWDARGFELTEDNPGVERIHVFFSRQPIRTGVKDMRVVLGDEAEGLKRQLTVSDYYERFLPQLRRELGASDPQWTGASFGYYYAKTLEGMPPDPPVLKKIEDANPAARLDRGAVIIVPEAIGAASFEGRDRDTARDLALLDARRAALEMALGVALTSETRVQGAQLVSDKIDLKSRTGYVKIVGEPKEDFRNADHCVMVKIRAEVAAEPTLLALNSGSDLQTLYAEMGHPRIACVLSEQVQGRENQQGGVVETQLNGLLRQRGFDPIDLAQAEALQDREKVVQALQNNTAAEQWLRTQFKAEVVLRGSATAKIDPGCKTPTGTTVQTALTLKLIEVASGDVLGTELVHDRIQVAAGDDEQNCRQALEIAASRAAKGSSDALGVVDKLIATWIAHPTHFTVVLQKATQAQVDAVKLKLQPAVDLRNITIDLARPESYRRTRSQFSDLKVRQFVANELATVDVYSQLRPQRVGEVLGKILGDLGWEAAVQEAGRINAVRKG